MSKSFKKKLPTILIVLALICFFLGMVLVAYTLSDTYQVVGECEPGSEGCTGITWQDTGVNVGSALLVLGPILAFVAIVLYEKGKKHEKTESNTDSAKDNNSKSKKQ